MMMEKFRICRECGREFTTRDLIADHEIPMEMASKCLCYECAYWSIRLKYDKQSEADYKMVLVTPDWKHYYTETYGTCLTVSSGIGGFYQTKLQPTYYFGLITEDSYQILHTNCLECQGTISRAMRKHFQINAVLLELWEYKMLTDTRNSSFDARAYILNKIKAALR